MLVDDAPPCITTTAVPEAAAAAAFTPITAVEEEEEVRAGVARVPEASWQVADVLKELRRKGGRSVHPAAARKPAPARLPPAHPRVSPMCGAGGGGARARQAARLCLWRLWHPQD